MRGQKESDSQKMNTGKFQVTNATQHILIVEDNDDDFECTYDAFHAYPKFRNPIRRARDGKEALAYLHHRPPFDDPLRYPRPSLILLDLNMPGIDGKAVLDDIRRYEELKSLPVIVFSTSHDPIDIEMCYRMGANSYVSKPTSLDGLLTAIQRVREYWFDTSIIPRQ